MNRERFVRMREIFHVACELDPPARSGYLDGACADDRGLRSEIEELFAQEDDSEDRRLATPAIGSSFLHNFDLAHGTSRLAAPLSIGGFRIIRKLGEGSMGVVYCAEQEHPRRTVALKVMRDWSMSPTLLARFRREADFLARLQHPGIARVFEAGVGTVHTAAGPSGEQPYFALEMIDGARLTDYVNQHEHDLRVRLELVACVCDAVHHAHCRGVIHRDLKPSNILVVDEGSGFRVQGSERTGGSVLNPEPRTLNPLQPKILDFGISRAPGDGQNRTVSTEAGQVLGTIAYASPEQLVGDQDAVDARSDVYSLGVILYEVLTGRLPIDVRGMDVPQAMRRVAESDPAPIGKLNPELRGDVASILGKALEKDRDRRYSSAAELAADIRRFLRYEPIAARPVTAMYTLSKFVRRHRAGVAGFALAFVAGIAGLSYGLIEARAQRDAALTSEEAAITARDAARAAESRAIEAGTAEQVARENAQRETRIAAAVNQFLNEDLLAAVNPDNTPNRDIRMRDVLDAAASKIEGRFPDDPLVEAYVRMTLGVTYLRLGEPVAAEPHLARALKLRREHAAATDPEFLEALGFIAALEFQYGRYVEAEAYLVEMLTLCRQAFEKDHELLAGALGMLGVLRMQRGRMAEAEPLLVESVEMQRRLSPGASDVIPALVNLASLQIHIKCFSEAEAALNEAIDLGRSALGEESPAVLTACSTLAALYNEQGEFDKAAPLLTTVLESQTRVLGPEHRQTLLTQANLAYSFLNAGRLDDADPLIDSVWETRARLLGEAHPHTLISHLHMAMLRRKQGRFVEAEHILVRGLNLLEGSAADTVKTRKGWVDMLFEVYTAQGRGDDAQALRAQQSND